MMPVCFERPELIHLVGIGGSGMRALAELLLDRGVSVSGSDSSASPIPLNALKRRGANVFHGHATSNVANDIDCVIASAAVPETNCELVAADERQIPRLTYPQALGQLMQGRVGISVIGTHGKSTTTAMIAAILEAAGERPSVICGAALHHRPCRERDELLSIVPHLGARNGWAGLGPWFIAESCEFRSHFLELSPEYAVLTGLEHDHPDCYPTLDAACDAYTEFVSSLPSTGRLVYWAESEAATKVAQAANCPIVPIFGSELHRYDEVQLPVPGEHNVINACLAAALCRELGATSDPITRGLNLFPGLQRRFEVHECALGVTVVDDYAHHPTAIAQTLATARSLYPGRRIICAFEPHQASRTEALMDQFANALSVADLVLLSPVHAAREQASDLHSELSQDLVKRVELLAGRERAAYSPSLDHLLATLETAVQPNDVVVMLGAGQIDRIAHEFSGRVRRDCAS